MTSTDRVLSVVIYRFPEDPKENMPDSPKAKFMFSIEQATGWELKDQIRRASLVGHALFSSHIYT